MKQKYDRWIWMLIGISLLIRLLLASQLEFGNDEVYYWLLSKYPALSYFDHPPLLFVMIRLLSFGHLIDAEWAIRLPSLLAVSVSTWLLYDLGRRIKSARAGFFAALLAQTSPYFFVISGIFVIPDGLLSLFWLTSLRSAFMFFDQNQTQPIRNRHLLLFGFFVGLGALTKYHILLLWMSFFLFAIGQLGHNKASWRSFLLQYRLYLALLITLLAFTPVLYWNFMAEYSSFKFHEERLSSFGQFQPLFFIREALGQLVYNNFIVVIISLVALLTWPKRKFISSFSFQFILWFSLPMPFLFLFFSLFRATFPHWSAPAYYLLIIMAGVFLDRVNTERFPRIISITLVFSVLVFLAAYFSIQKAWLINDRIAPDKDVTLNMYGWKQLSEKFIENSEFYPTSTKMIIDNKWFNASHLDYYLCRNSDYQLMGVGSILDIHEYARINKERGFNALPLEAIFFESQSAGFNPFDTFSRFYSQIVCIDTIHIYRENKEVKQIKVHLLKGRIE
jgi:hypothetical protein